MSDNIDKKQQLENKVKDIVSEQLDVEKDKISLVSSFIDDLGADSLDQVELVMALEEAFDCEISDEEAEKLVTVGDAVNYIVKFLMTDEK